MILRLIKWLKPRKKTRQKMDVKCYHCNSWQNGDFKMLPGKGDFMVMECSACSKFSEWLFGPGVYIPIISITPSPHAPPVKDDSFTALAVSALRRHRFCGDQHPDNGWPEISRALGKYNLEKKQKSRRGSVSSTSKRRTGVPE